MKKIILLINILAIAGWNYISNAQPCDISVPGVKLNYSVTEESNCRINVDLYFDLRHNPGGKWIWVHVWPTSAYSNWNYSSPPTVANGGLTGSIATVGAEHQGLNLVVASNYPPDNTAPGFQSAGISVFESAAATPNFERYTFKNIELIVPGGCNIPQSFSADVWESQASNSQVIHCFSKGLIFYANDPKVTGLLFCTNPRNYKFDISTINTAGLTVDYKVVLDMDGNGIYNPAVDNITVNSGTATMNAGNNYKFSSGVLDYPPYSGLKPYSDLPLWVVVSGSSLSYEIYGFIANTCIPLPVKFASFGAVRNNENVHINWSTAFETNNKGFFIERKAAEENWQQMGFVFSKAAQGNSNELLQYQFNDVNILKSISQYRIAQMDLDGKTSYSDIRMVKGLGQSVKLLVFPNPSPDGQINVVMENISTATVLQLIDMNGKVIRSWANITNNKIVMDGVKSGIYILRALPGDGNESLNVKLFVGK